MELYKKYRPTTFDDVVGQDDVLARLREAVKQKSVPHATLFTGGSGVGKTTLARILARELGINDLNTIESNSADSRKIDDVRDLARQITHRPLGGEKRFVIIDEAQGLTAAAQDALLKVLEECPEHTYVALLTTDKAKLKNTVLTRCAEYHLSSIDEPSMTTAMMRVVEGEGHEAPDDNMLRRIYRLSRGSLREALTLLEQCMVVSYKDWRKVLTEADESDINTVVEAILNGDRKAVVKALATSDSWKSDPEGFRRYLLSRCGRMMLTNQKNDYAKSAFETFVGNYNLYSPETIPGLIDIAMR